MLVTETRSPPICFTRSPQKFSAATTLIIEEPPEIPGAPLLDAPVPVDAGCVVLGVAPESQAASTGPSANTSNNESATDKARAHSWPPFSYILILVPDIS